MDAADIRARSQHRLFGPYHHGRDERMSVKGEASARIPGLR